MSEGDAALTTMPAATQASPRRRIGSGWLLLAPALACILVFAVALTMAAGVSLHPNAGMARIGEGWTLANYIQFVSDPFYRGYLTRSVVISGYCTVIVAVLGYPVAFMMAVAGTRLRTLITVIVVSQFFTAYVIRSFALVSLLGRTGIVNQALLALGLIDAPLRIMYSEAAVALGLVVVSLPYMILPVYSSIHAIPPNLTLAARSLGANSLRTFWKIVVPLSYPGLAAGSVLVFLFCFTAYVIPAILGGMRFPMIGNLIIETAMDAQNFPFAAAASFIALAVSMIVSFLIQKGFERRTGAVQ